jgi:hypothetical protein
MTDPTIRIANDAIGCTCTFTDDGDGDDLANPEMIRQDPACPVHGRDAMPDAWRDRRATETRRPPETIKLRGCPECGRTDRYGAFTGKSHFATNGRCPGQPIIVVYRRPNDADVVIRHRVNEITGVVDRVMEEE